MIVFGLVWMLVASRMPGREPVRVYPEGGPMVDSLGEGKNRTTKTAEERASDRNRRRRHRKKLR